MSIKLVNSNLIMKNVLCSRSNVSRNISILWTIKFTSKIKTVFAFCISRYSSFVIQNFWFWSLNNRLISMQRSERFCDFTLLIWTMKACDSFEWYFAISMMWLFISKFFFAIALTFFCETHFARWFLTSWNWIVLSLSIFSKTLVFVISSTIFLMKKLFIFRSVWDILKYNHLLFAYLNIVWVSTFSLIFSSRRVDTMLKWEASSILNLNLDLTLFLNRFDILKAIDDERWIDVDRSEDVYDEFRAMISFRSLIGFRFEKDFSSDSTTLETRSFFEKILKDEKKSMKLMQSSVAINDCLNKICKIAMKKSFSIVIVLSSLFVFIFSRLYESFYRSSFAH